MNVLVSDLNFLVGARLGKISDIFGFICCVFITRYCFIAIMHGRSGKNLFKALFYFYGQAKSMDSSILGNIVSCYQNRIVWQAFLWKHFVDSVFD